MDKNAEPGDEAVREAAEQIRTLTTGRTMKPLNSKQAYRIAEEYAPAIEAAYRASLATIREFREQVEDMERRLNQ